MPNQATLEEGIKNYTHKLLADHVVFDYGYQIKKWKDYINTVLDAERLAHQNLEEVLKKVIQNMEEEQQNLAIFGMIALSLVGGVALSWLSGAIQYKLFPKLAGNWKLNKTGVYLEKHTSKGVSVGDTFLMIKSELDYNKVTAKVFGDGVTNAGRIGLDRFSTPSNKRDKASTLTNFDSLNIQENTNAYYAHASLKTILEKTLSDEQEMTTKSIAGSALNILNSSGPQGFAKMILDETYTKNPSLKDKDDILILEAAKKHAEWYVDEACKLWGENWFYYGHNPPNTSIYEMSRKIEREMWAMWILEQDFKINHYTVGSMGEMPGENRIRVIGKDKIRFDDLIVTRLKILNVVQAQSFQWKVIQKTNHNIERYRSPNIQIDRELDDDRELGAIKYWANNHPIEKLAAPHESQKRIIPKVRDIHIQ